MAKRWKLLDKVAEECGELIVELMKLRAFPDGKHPGRQRSVILSTEDEIADVLATLEYFVARNKLDTKRIQARKTAKLSKFILWSGPIDGKSKKKVSKKSS